ncbi:MAG: TonB-dependent receptor, partial [Fulvivirga sp.]
MTIIFGDHAEAVVQADRVLIIEKQFTVSGYIKEEDSGETLIGVNIIFTDASGHQSGVTTNLYGFYSISLAKGTYQVSISYIGHESYTASFDLHNNYNLTVHLKDKALELSEVVVRDNIERQHLVDNLDANLLGHIEMDIADIQSAPAIMGEPDLVKVIQTQPGVQTQGEGSTNFYVRGGSADQNLILLDEATVYNPSHLMGFFSVFNADAVKHVELYKSGIPAAYGGRISSLLDVRLREGNKNRIAGSGGIGALASRLTLEGPLVNNKSSFIVSGRRTYADMFLKLSQDEFTRKTAIYFYDLNAKMNFEIDSKNKLFLSGYFGRDVAKIKTLQYGLQWGNATFTSRWNHLFSDRLFANTSLIFSQYDYLLDLGGAQDNVNWTSQIADYSLKSDFNYYLNKNNFLTFGLQSVFHKLRPGESKENAEEGVPRYSALESALYIENETSLSEKLQITYGIRYSLFQTFGEGVALQLDSNYDLIEEKEYESGETMEAYGGLEPRLKARYKLTHGSSLKASYSRNRQYLQVLSNLSLGLNVFDLWFPATNNIKPQIADQFSVGYFRNVEAANLELSVEGYYKNLQNQIDYSDHSRLLLNRYVEQELRTGKGRAYGVEFLAKRRTGRLTGWLSYTISRSEWKVEGINNNNYYLHNADQTHNLNLTGVFHFNYRVRLASSFTYATGRPVTLPVESYTYEGRVVPVYENRNSGRLPNYHRLDLSIEIDRKKKRQDAKWSSSWNFGLYNVYNRHNAASVFLSPELRDLGE